MNQLASIPVRPRVRFAPSPTGFLHVGSARTFIFNWLYARRTGGTMILRIDDTDVERNTDASVTSIFEGLKWLGLDWDEEYRQSERIDLHRKMAEAIFQKGLAYRDFTPAHTGDSERSGAQGTWLCNPGMGELSRAESDRRAAAGEPFALRFRVPREEGQVVRFNDAVYGEQMKAGADIEDFALLRSDGMPTYHLASCADDVDLRISHIIRGQDHLTNTFKHVLIFEAAGYAPPQFAHLPLLVAPDGTKLSKRRHGAVVSVTTYRDAGFLPEAFINFLCLLGWSPKDDRTKLSLQELIDAFSLEGINRANAVVNFKEIAAGDWFREKVAVAAGIRWPSEETFDPKALWLNAEHIRGLTVEDLSARLLPIVREVYPNVTPEKMLQITPLIRERIRLLRDVLTAADFFFVNQLPPYDPAELIPQKGDAAMASKVLEKAQAVLANVEFKHDPLDHALRAAAQELGLKAGQMFQPIRVAACGRKNAPPLFETLEVLGKDKTLERLSEAFQQLHVGTIQGRKYIKLIYLDTNIWNRLADQNVDPSKLLTDLARRNANLALSGQTVYELSKTFLGRGSDALSRGQQLFRYIKHYVDAGIPCAHDNMEQLRGEVTALNTGASEVIAFYGPNEYVPLKIEVDKLSQGICDERAKQFIAGRQQFSESTRLAQRNHFVMKEEVRDRLETVPESRLGTWLKSEMLTDRGVATLVNHLLRMYEGLPAPTAFVNARALLQIPASRIAKGIVQADLYFNWRCANRGSNPHDLVDDLYHVLNASYCSIYATAEAKQAEYASLILSQWTRVAIYDDSSPIDTWLTGLV